MLSVTLKTELPLGLKKSQIACLNNEMEGRFRICSSRLFQKERRRHDSVRFYKMVPKMEVLSSSLPYVLPLLSGVEEHLKDKQMQSH